jgi:hypothetical protein
MAPRVIYVETILARRVEVAARAGGMSPEQLVLEALRSIRSLRSQLELPLISSEELHHDHLNHAE